MNKGLLIIGSILAASVITTSCNNKQQGSNGISKADSTQVVEDEEKDEDAVKLTTKKITKSINNNTGEYKLTIDFPESDNEILANAIREYISESLGSTYGGGEEETKRGSYSGDLADGEQMAKYYFDIKVKEFTKMYNSLKEEGMPDVPQMASETEITRGYENSKVVTYNFSSYEDAGGAHGASVGSGMTFRKSDGRRIGWELFYTVKMQSILRDGLKEYFSVKTEEELESCLSLNSIYSIPLPVTPPLFTEKGIAVIYQQYEIAAYAAGMPQFTIPYKDARKMLNNTGKKLLP
jgi:hypothetical protein